VGADQVSRSKKQGGGPDRDEERPKGADVVEVALDEQARVAEEFLARLTEEFGLDASIATVSPDEDTVELQITGPNLGLLIGQKGATLVALQSITRSVVQHRTGANNGHLNVDVGGYRQKRTDALIRFSTDIARNVAASGKPTALEPMSAVDRKVVHDTIGSIPGVATSSEGEEPRRRVVVRPVPVES
jgi:spoIIIJ-associated protein